MPLPHLSSPPLPPPLQALNEVVMTVGSRRAKGSTTSSDVLDAGGGGRHVLITGHVVLLKYKV